MNDAALFTNPAETWTDLALAQKPAPRRSFHGAGAIVAGIVTTVVSSTAIDQVLHTTRVYPARGARMADALFLIALGYRLVCNAAGGYVAACIGTPRTARTLQLAPAPTIWTSGSGWRS
jgi:hypothetical protein